MFLYLSLSAQYSVQHGSCLNHEHTHTVIRGSDDACDHCFSQIWNWQIYHRGGSGLHSGEVHSACQAVEGDEVSYSCLILISFASDLASHIMENMRMFKINKSSSCNHKQLEK